MLATKGTYFGEPIVIICDARCDKAWGIAMRPQELLSTDEDDFAWLSDDELGDAPIDPGTYEGPDAKPVHWGQRHNKWCARQCERSVILGRKKTSRV